MTRLGLTMPIGADEPLSHYCSRIAALNLAESAQSFSTLLGFSFIEVTRGCSAAVERFSELAGLTPAEAQRATVLHVDTRSRQLAGHLFSKKFVANTKVKFCPLCFAEDEVTMSGRRGFRARFRMSWLPRFLRACPVHEVTLLTHKFGDWRLRCDPYAWIRVSGRQWRDFEPDCVPMRLTVAEKYFLRRIRNEPNSDLWLDDLSPQAALHFVEILGAVERHGIEVQFGSLSLSEQSASAATGFEIASGGTTDIKSVLTGLTKGYYRSKSPMGAHAVFGELADEMSAYQSFPGYNRVLELMQETAIENLPIGPGQKFLRDVRYRKLHSVHSASREAGIGARLLWRFLYEAGLAPVWDQGYSKHRVVLPVSIIAPYVEKAVEWDQKGKRRHGMIH